MPESCMKIETFNDYYTTIKETGDQGDRSRDSLGTSDYGPVPLIVIPSV